MKIEPLNVANRKDFYEFLGLYWEYWLKVNEDDLSREMVWHMADGTAVVTTELEAMYEWYARKGSQVQLARSGDCIVGFLHYQDIFDCMIVVRGMYLEDEYVSTKVGHGLVNSLKPKKLIFQTRKEKPPEAMLKATEPYREKVDEDDKLITWIMDWGG